MYTNSKVFRCLKMQEEMIDNGDCVGTASGAVFCSEHNVGICLVRRSRSVRLSLSAKINQP
jgi:hypothetical protein